LIISLWLDQENPTLHSKIRSIIEGLKKMTSIPVAVITEWFLALRARGEGRLLQADIVLPSLDAVSQEIFMRINRPRSGVSIEKVIEGMSIQKKVYKAKFGGDIIL